MSEKKTIQKSDWRSRFMLIGKPIIGDFTFKMDERSEKSNWIYNALNLGVDCGENAGNIYCELMGGYSADNTNVIYAFSKKEENSESPRQQIVVDWDDRFNDEVLEQIDDMSFISVGLEKTDKGKLFVKKFLSAYDAIAYVKDHLSENMIVNVSGNLKYSTYNDNVQVRKNITSIVLSKVENPSDFKATFTQSVLIDKDSASLKNINKDKGVMYVDTKVLDYIKEVDGIEVKGQYPYCKQFEFPMNFADEAQCKKIMDKLFKVKRGYYNQITFEGAFIEGGAVVTATWDDIPDDIKDLVEMGVYTKEEALAKCTANGNRERRMVLIRPSIEFVGEEKKVVVQKFEERYTEDDLALDYVFNNDKSNNKDDKAPFDADEEETGTDNNMDWLANL